MCEQKDLFVEETLPPCYDFGSFPKILVQSTSDEFICPWNAGKRKIVTVHHTTLPGAIGYWNIRGREHKVYYKKKLIAILLTEDCGMGTAKAHTFLRERGFKLA